MHQRTHRPTVLIHSNLRVTSSAIATARRSPPARPSLARGAHSVGTMLRYGLRHPLVTLTIAISCLLFVGTVGEAQAAAQINTQIAQTQAQNAHINQQIAQTNALIVQISQDSAIIIAALKLGYVMPPGGATP